METLLRRLRADFPYFTFSAGERLHWSAETVTISYQNESDDHAAAYGILHELGHARLGHKHYTSDIELLAQEVAAWEGAKELAAQYGVATDDNYAEDCLDSYRAWLHTRSACPTCSTHGVEQARNSYICLNCGATWSVSDNRFCRTYRVEVPTN